MHAHGRPRLLGCVGRTVMVRVAVQQRLGRAGVLVEMRRDLAEMLRALRGAVTEMLVRRRLEVSAR